MGADARENADERLAGNVRKLRKQAGMTQDALAEAMAGRGWPWYQSTVYRVEKGQQPLRAAELIALAAILKTSLDSFTWSSAEATETAFIYAAGTEVRLAYENVAGAVLQMLAHAAFAERALESSAGSESPRVQAARRDTAARLREFSLDEAVGEGIRRYETRGSEGGEDG